MKQKRFFVAAGMSCLVFLFIFLAFGLTYAAEEKGKVIELKFANFFPPPAGQSKICEEFIQELEQRTGGRVKVRYFAGGSLLAAPAMIKGIESGTTDIGLSHVEYTLGRFPITEVCDLPLGLSDRMDQQPDRERFLPQVQAQGMGQGKGALAARKLPFGAYHQKTRQEDGRSEGNDHQGTRPYW